MAYTLKALGGESLSNLSFSAVSSSQFVQQNLGTVFVFRIILLATLGTLVLLSTKKILRWTGGLTAIVLLSVAVHATANLGFRATVLAGSEEGATIALFIPLYLSFVAPVAVFDKLVKEPFRRRSMVLAGALIGPFAAYLDGFNSYWLVTQAASEIPILAIITFLVGLGIAAKLYRPRHAAMQSLEQPSGVLGIDNAAAP